MFKLFIRFVDFQVVDIKVISFAHVQASVYVKVVSFRHVQGDVDIKSYKFCSCSSWYCC